MFSYIKRHWPVYVVLFLIAIAMGLGAAYIVGAKGSTPRSTMSEEVEQEQSLGADGISDGDLQLVDGGRAGISARPLFLPTPLLMPSLAK